MRKGERTRKDIVERALELSGEVGLEGLSLGLLAAAMNLSKSGLFAHFGSKEALQLEVLKEAVGRFADHVVKPALAEPRGEPRVTALLENYLAWIEGRTCRGACILIAFAHEFDDRQGPVREFVIRALRDWRGVLMRATRIAMEEGHFRPDLDAEQFCDEFTGVVLAFQQARKLFDDSRARTRARNAFAGLLARSRRDVRPQPVA